MELAREGSQIRAQKKIEEHGRAVAAKTLFPSTKTSAEPSQKVKRRGRRFFSFSVCVPHWREPGTGQNRDGGTGTKTGNKLGHVSLSPKRIVFTREIARRARLSKGI